MSKEDENQEEKDIAALVILFCVALIAWVEFCVWYWPLSESFDWAMGGPLAIAVSWAIYHGVRRFVERKKL
jgi:hypothetical protein